MIQKLTVFSKALTPEEFDRPRPDRLEKGNPLRKHYVIVDRGAVQ